MTHKTFLKKFHFTLHLEPTTFLYWLYITTTAAKIDLQFFSKLMAVEKSVFTSSQCPFAIQLINSIIFITACLLLSNLNRICKFKQLLLGTGGTHPLLRTLLCPQPHLNQ